MISWLGPHKTTVEVADGGRKGHCLCNRHRSFSLSLGSHKHLLQRAFITINKDTFSLEREYSLYCQTPTQSSMLDIAS